MDSKSSASLNTQQEAGSPLSAFDYAPSTRIIFGAGSLDRLGELSSELGAKRILLVTDKGLAEAGHEARAVASLEKANLQITIFDDVHPNPTTEDVERGLQVARNHQIDLIVGLGGGSSMDCAKGINFLLTNGGQMQDYWGVGKAAKPMLPLIAVPTTAGTGSEAQSFAVIAHPETHIKMACGDKKAACKIAILDPELTLTMPRSVTHVTGIDALSHALETFVTKPRNEISQLFSRRAWSLLANSFPKVLETPDDLTARGNMQLGAHFAGAAIENSMLGATHALANPLSAHFDLTHGVAIGIMLPHVIRFNAELVGEYYSVLAADIGLCESHDPAGAGLLAEHIQSLIATAGAPTSLTECNVDPSLMDQLAEEASRQWTGNFNPRPVDQSSLRELYECAF
ncbi:iron-containing alcohol dehydrogenase [uncultured Gimesia sp.]|uniref:iron-containing alcohol dehydrogenase n=1 Tax=uncultured Gimesia sp. TaxID=1678688 RepID=UPI00261E9970|nr:iron-containing alcohol dehydrogenase [uncultured Gimesia sp.]